jgi:hypothetical protein
MLESALKAAGKQARLVELKGEDHWLSRSETRIQVLTDWSVSWPKICGRRAVTSRRAAAAGR